MLVSWCPFPDVPIFPHNYISLALYFIIKTLVANELSGSIPSEIGLLKSLEYLYLSKWLYQVLMCLSPFFVILFLMFFSPLYCNTAYYTVSNTIDSNELTGLIPIEIGLLTSLRDLLLCKLLNESRIIFVCFYFILNYLFVFPHYSSLNFVVHGSRLSIQIKIISQGPYQVRYWRCLIMILILWVSSCCQRRFVFRLGV